MPVFALKNYILSYRFSENKRSDRKDYYQQFLYEMDIESVINLLEKTPVKEVPVQSEINFQNIQFGSSVKEVRRLLGRENYSLSLDTEYNDYQIKVYRKSSGKFTIMAVCHFLNNQLFIINNVSSNPLGNLKGRTVSQLNEKYKLSLLSDKDVYLVDDQENRFLLLDDVYVRSYYISGSEIFKQWLDEEAMALIVARTAKGSKKATSHLI
jgi:hypothetical protein